MHLLAVDLLRLIRSLQDKRPPFFRFSFCTCRRSIIHRTAQNTHTSKISADVRRNPVNIYYSGCISICQAFFWKKRREAPYFGWFFLCLRQMIQKFIEILQFKIFVRSLSLSCFRGWFLPARRELLYHLTTVPPLPHALASHCLSGSLNTLHLPNWDRLSAASRRHKCRFSTKLSTIIWSFPPKGLDFQQPIWYTIILEGSARVSEKTELCGTFLPFFLYFQAYLAAAFPDRFSTATDSVISTVSTSTVLY